jgi:predicted dienelactone hydrolase
MVVFPSNRGNMQDRVLGRCNQITADHRPLCWQGHFMKSIAVVPLLAGVLLALLATSIHADYDPLQVSQTKPEQQDLTVKDVKRSREIPIRVYLPESKTAAPVILFSHGLGGSRAGYAYLGNQWAARGYVCVFLQHPGSDDAVWKNAARLERLTALRKAASLENFQLRVRDVSSVLDQLEAWNKESQHLLSGRMDLKRVGMAGHSFGAVTTQAVSGQAFPIGPSMTDSRIKAAIPMSPSAARRGVDPKQAFGKVSIPWLLMTGTRDNSPIGEQDPKSRLMVYPALPAGGKYEVVLDNAEHSAFSDRELPGETGKHNPNHHRSILALSTAFWDTYLRDDPEAKKWIEGAGPKSILVKDDQWQKK